MKHYTKYNTNHIVNETLHKYNTNHITKETLHKFNTNHIIKYNHMGNRKPLKKLPITINEKNIIKRGKLGRMEGRLCLSSLYLGASSLGTAR